MCGFKLELGIYNSIYNSIFTEMERIFDRSFTTPLLPKHSRIS